MLLLRSWDGSLLWSGKPTSIVHNEEGDDILRRRVYTMGNPVADGIEREGENHKGLRKRWPRPDKVIKRPPFFWRPLEKGGVASDEVTLRFTRPPKMGVMTDGELDGLIEGRVLAYEKKERELRLEKGGRFRCDVEDEVPDRNSFPISSSKFPPGRISPQIGAIDKERRKFAIARLREFLSKHEDARLRHKAGEPDVVFPLGTWQAVQCWNVKVELSPCDVLEPEPDATSAAPT